MSDILIIDLATGHTERRPLADPLAGGRLLSAQLVAEFVPPTADPLGPGNILALVAGPLAGMRVSTAGRLSVGGKSPLTGGIKEANAGGMAGDSLEALGLRAVVFRNGLAMGQWAVCVIDEAGVRLVDAAAFAGLNNEAARDRLWQAFGDDYVSVTIGRPGEMLLPAAGVAVTDAQGNPFRMAARGGMGAVMGSKGLKAVLIRRAGGRSARATGARESITALHKHVANDQRVSELRSYGTSSTLALANALGALPTRNFSDGKFAGAEAIGGDALRATILARGGVGTPTHACMEGCLIQCSNIMADEQGELAVSPVEFETLGLCGSNLAFDSLDDIARINRLCNDLGLDTIETGAGLGVMMEAAALGCAPEEYRDQLPHWGEAQRAAEIVAQVGEGTALGKLLGSGVVAVGKALNVRRVPAVKGQAMSAYDPRVIKGTGVTYATSPQGADHTAGLTVFAPVDHTDGSKAVALSRGAQIQRGGYDALGLCVFNLGATGRRPELVLDIVEQAYGVKLPEGWLEGLGRRVIEVERAFNRAAGFTAADDRLPAYFTEETVPSTGTRWDVPGAELDAMWG